MSSEAIATIATAAFVGLCAFLGTIATNAYYYGRLTKAVEVNSADIAELRGKTDDHGERLAAIEGPPAKANGAAAGWRG